MNCMQDGMNSWSTMLFVQPDCVLLGSDHHAANRHSAACTSRPTTLHDLEVMLTTWCRVTGSGSSTSKKADQLCHPDPK